MSNPPFPDREMTRIEKARASCSSRTGTCIVCKCEAFEAQSGLVDGFVTCVCHHTQWGHKHP